MIDLTSKKTFSDKLNPIIDRHLVIERSKEPSRDYLGASIIGHECERSLQFDFFHTPKDKGKDFEGKILRVFRRGHMFESAMVEWIRGAGVKLENHIGPGLQFGFSDFGGLFRGHCDGIMTGGPVEFGPFPRLWENKGLQAKYWRAIAKHGLLHEIPTYYSQCQIYMQAFGLTQNPALFSAVNADTMEIYWEQIVFNQSACNKLYEKARRVLLACRHGELLPKLSNNKDFYVCKMCSWVERCFSL